MSYSSVPDSTGLSLFV